MGDYGPSPHDRKGPGWRGKKGASQMMEPRHKEAGHEDWTGRYERLRQHALGEPAPASGCVFGLEALLQNGMAVWMRVLPTAGTRTEEMEPAYAACDWLAT